MHDLSEAQIEFMRVLWSLDEATVTRVQAELRDQGRDLATTTVATVLKRLHKRGLVDFRVEGRQHVYRALVSEDHVRGSVLRRVTRSLFKGDPAALLSHLIDHDDVSDEDLQAVRALLDARTEGGAS